MRRSVIAPGTDEARAHVLNAARGPGRHHGPAAGTLHRSALHHAQGVRRRGARPRPRTNGAGNAPWCRFSGLRATITTMPRPAPRAGWMVPGAGQLGTAAASGAIAPQLSMAEEHLPPEVLAGLQLLEARRAGAPAAGDNHARDDRASKSLLAWLSAGHYVPGATFNAAFAGSVAEFLAPFGILCFDPTHIAAKQAQAPFIRTALRRAAELDTALADLPDAGTGIAAGEGATLVFLATDVGRDRLLIDGDGFRGRRSGERFTLPEVESLLDREPARFSANVLLRPIVESALLPTVAYVAGPSEMRCFLERQASTLYPLFGVPPTGRRSFAGRARSSCAGPNGCSAGCVSPPIRCSMMTARSPGAFLEHDFPRRRPPGRPTHSGSRSPEVPVSLRRQWCGSILGTRPGAMSGRMQRLSQLTDDIENVIRRHLRRRDDIAYGHLRLRQSLPSRWQATRVAGHHRALARAPERALLAAPGAMPSPRQCRAGRRRCRRSGKS